MDSDAVDEMLRAAMVTLKPELPKLKKEGVPFDERALFFADASAEPGKTIAIHNLSQLPGGSVERATKDWAVLAEKARVLGKPLHVSMMLTIENVVQYVDAMASGDRSGIEGFPELLRGPVPKDHFRIVLVTTDGQVYLRYVHVTPRYDILYVPKDPGLPN